MSRTHRPYPATRSDDFVDVLHGVTVPDPFRWLEDGSDPAVRAWASAQNAFTEEILVSLPGRERIETRLTALLQVPEVLDGQVAGDRIFTHRLERGREQPVLFVRDGLDGEDRVVLDPAIEDASGLLGLDWWRPSRDGALVACGVSEAGKEWSELRIRDVASGVDLDEGIPRCRSASVAWLPDNAGFFYTRYPLPGEVPAEEENYWRRVYLHLIGTDWRADALVWGEGRPMTELPWLTLDATGRWFIVDANEGWSRTDIFVLDRHHPENGFRDITPPGESTHNIVTVIDGVIYSRTYAGAPNGVLLSRALEDEHASWKTVIPERADVVLNEIVATADGFISSEMENAVAVVRRYRRDGALLETIGTPEVGSVEWIAGSPDARTALIGFTSFLRPLTALALLPGEPVRTLVTPDLPEGFDAGGYEIHQEWCTSKDGTSVPICIVHRKGVRRDGTNPTVLSGYGGFRLPVGSSYDPSLPLWLEQGGVYAVACLRGGGEFGMAWHQAGTQHRKQNVFDDFIAASQHLIARGYTSPEHLGITGNSNGGLLTGAAMTQRPDLYRAVRIGVPLLDMLRYHRFLIARIWIPEYGCADDPDDFPYLHAWSPYHAVRDGVAYPATLVTCAENDSRVDPLHARKMVARLQTATASDLDQPVLLRSTEDAGHGSGKPLYLRVREAADTWSFFGWQLGVDWANP